MSHGARNLVEADRTAALNNSTPSHFYRLVRAEVNDDAGAPSKEADANQIQPYWFRPRIDAGWPGSLSDLPVLMTRMPFLVSSTRRMDTSLSM